MPGFIRRYQGGKENPWKIKSYYRWNIFANHFRGSLHWMMSSCMLAMERYMHWSEKTAPVNRRLSKSWRAYTPKTVAKLSLTGNRLNRKLPSMPSVWELVPFTKSWTWFHIWVLQRIFASDAIRNMALPLIAKRCISVPQNWWNNWVLM